MSRLDDILEGVLGPTPSAPIAVPAGHGLFTGQEARDTEGSQSFSVPNGTQLDQRTSFVVGSVIVDNNTSAWLNVPDATKDGVGRWVPPGYPGSFPILGHISRARINWSAPPGKLQPPAIAGEAAQVVFLASPIPPGFGVAAGASPTGRANAFPLASRAIGTYNFVPPNLQGIKGIIVYYFSTAGTGTGTVSVIVSDAIGGNTVAGGINSVPISSTAVAAGSGVNLFVYPGITVISNVAAALLIGQTPNISVVVATGPVTFGVDYDLVA